MAKYLVETYYTCTFKVNHHLDSINETELKKYDWQKPHQENLTGTESAYYPNKNKNAIQKKYKSWKD